MKRVIIDFVPKCERYNEIRLTFVSDGFNNIENQGYTCLMIAAKHADVMNISLETAMNPYSFFEKLWKFGLGEDDLQKIIEAFNENKYIQKDLVFFADCGDMTKDEFIQAFYDRIEEQAFKKLADEIWNGIMFESNFGEKRIETFELKDYPISFWLYGRFDLAHDSECEALRLDQEFDDWAVSQDYGDYGFKIKKDGDKCLVSVKMHYVDNN